MADDWYYARKGERFGPVPWAKVRSLAEQGWLMPGDLIWTPDMSDWQPAASVKGLFKNSLVESLGSAVDGVIPGIRPVPAGLDSTAAGGRGRGPESPFGPDFFEHLAPRHLVAGCGAFVAALGIAFTAISPSSLGLAFTLGGLALAAAGMYSEVGAFLAQAVANIATARINGTVWFFLVGVGYLALILPGMLLHFFCIVGAASGNPWTPGRTEVVRR